MNIAERRIEYGRGSLDIDDLDPDPFRQFQLWFDVAVKAGVPEPEAMTLATATCDGAPSARIVLLRGVDARGFTFFSNYESRKGRELLANPRGALVFYWQGLERQVRVEGCVERCTAEESDAYFHSRPDGARIGAWASDQSEVVAGRRVLEEAQAALERRFAGREVPRPAHWGGFRVVPESIEFWQGRASRLHDRLRYRRESSASAGWIIERLSP